MGKISEAAHTVTTTEVDQIVAIGFPGRAALQKLAIVRVGGGMIEVNLYNRDFGSPDYAGLLREPENHDLTGRTHIPPDGSKTAFESTTPVLVREGDVMQLRAPGTEYDNLSAEVLSVSANFNTVLLDTPLVAGPRQRATANLAIPLTDHPLYQVLPGQTGSDSLVYFPEAEGGRIVFHNRDVQSPTYSLGVIRRIYVQFAEAGTYKVAIAGTGDIY